MYGDILEKCASFCCCNGQSEVIQCAADVCEPLCSLHKVRETVIAQLICTFSPALEVGA